MKYIRSLIVSSMLLGQIAWATAERPLLVSVPLNQVFVPGGFDDNDNVQIVLEGSFSDTCHKLAHTEVLKSEDGTGIQVIQWARKFSGVCIPTTVPFKSEVNLGRLAEGSYTIESTGADVKTLSIIHADINSQDNFVYAPVVNAKVGRRNTGHYVATLTGTLPNDCFNFAKTDMLVQDKVLVLLPVITYQDSGSCKPMDKPFELAIDLPPNLDAGKYLVHIRSMSGKAVNVVFFADGD